METTARRDVHDPIVDEIMRLRVSCDVRESALEHYRIGSGFIEALCTVTQSLARIPRVLRGAVR